jgi:hypothetical protein
MKTKLLLWCAIGLLVALTGAQAATLYVDAASTNSIAPYTSWASAAVTIQDAVDAAVPGDEIVVTNGVYATGTRGDIYGGNNRVVVAKPITLRSVNGPDVTSIVGFDPDEGAEARCVYLTNGAVLAGFTLINGVADNGGGVYCEGQSAVVSNCVLTGNSADSGGGAYQGTLNNCMLMGNVAWGSDGGGGAIRGTLNNCVLSGNSAEYGGGAAWTMLTYCTITGNSTWEGDGGGAYISTLRNCTLAQNSAGGSGGAACVCEMNNCALTRNSAIYGGGAYGGTLNDCTLTGNSASYGGGARYAWLNNCIVYYNSASLGGDNYDNGGLTFTLNYSCTTPAPETGVGNITNAPLFVDTNGWSNLRLQSNSPCINAGNNAYVTAATDLDGLPRIVNGTVDMGAFEWQVPALFNALARPCTNGLALSLTGESNRVYAVQASSNLTSWFPLGLFTNLPGAAPVVDAPSPPPAARFYRAQPVP